MKKRSGKGDVDTTGIGGGWVSREKTTGRFVEVRSESGVSKASDRSEAALRDASSKRSSALKRLADR